MEMNFELTTYTVESDSRMNAGGVYVDHVAEYKFAFANGVGCAMLPYTGTEESVTEVCYAEAAAGGGAYEQC